MVNTRKKQYDKPFKRFTIRDAHVKRIKQEWKEYETLGLVYRLSFLHSKTIRLEPHKCTYLCTSIIERRFKPTKDGLVGALYTTTKCIGKKYFLNVFSTLQKRWRERNYIRKLYLQRRIFNNHTITFFPIELEKIIISYVVNEHSLTD